MYYRDVGIKKYYDQLSSSICDFTLAKHMTQYTYDIFNIMHDEAKELVFHKITQNR